MANDPQGTKVSCEECKKVQLLETRRRQLQGKENLDDFRSVTNEDWKLGVFQKAVYKEGYIWEAATGCDIILPCDVNIIAEHKEANRAIENFGGREGLKHQKKQAGEIALMSHSLGFPGTDGKFEQVTRYLFFPIYGTSEGKQDEASLFQSLKQTKKHIIEAQRTKIAIPAAEGINGLSSIRMLEFLFANTEVQIEIYKKNRERDQRPSEETKAGGTRRKDNFQGKSFPKLKTREKVQDAILIKTGGKSYADLLKTIKQSVNPSDLGVDVRDLKRSKNGELILSVSNGIEKIEALRKELEKKVPSISTTLLTKKKVLHVKGMDEITTIEEIKEAVERDIGGKREVFEVRALRPAYGGRQNATVIMRALDADKILKKGRIKIGWTNCIVTERKQEYRCPKCWGSGHTKDQCKGPDREKLCLKCGKEGHRAAQCMNPAFCVHCKVEGHQSMDTRAHLRPETSKAEEMQTHTNSSESPPNQLQ